MTLITVLQILVLVAEVIAWGSVWIRWWDLFWLVFRVFGSCFLGSPQSTRILLPLRLHHLVFNSGRVGLSNLDSKAPGVVLFIWALDRQLMLSWTWEASPYIDVLVQVVNVHHIIPVKVCGIARVWNKASNLLNCVCLLDLIGCEFASWLWLDQLELHLRQWYVSGGLRLTDLSGEFLNGHHLVYFPVSEATG